MSGCGSGSQPPSDPTTPLGGASQVGHAGTLSESESVPFLKAQLTIETAGAVRDGGSFTDRMGKVACWNAVMDENQYMVRKWNEFIAS